MVKWMILVTTALMMGCVTGDIEWPDLPILPLEPEILPEEVRLLPYPKPSEPINGLLMTDGAVMLELKKLRVDNGDMDNLRKAFNTVNLVLDLPVPLGLLRSYCGPGRTTDRVSSLAWRNIRMWRERNFRIMVTPLNEPSVRIGFAGYMSGIGNNSSATPENMYSEVQLTRDMAVWKDLHANGKELIYAGMLCLENSTTASRTYCKRLAEYIRKDLGWSEIRLFSNGIGKGYWSGDTSLKVESSTSLNSFEGWCSTREDLPNGDGQFWMNEANARARLPTMVTCKREWIIWYPDLRGSEAGYGPLYGWHWKIIYDALN